MIENDEYLKISPLLFLRNQNKAYTKQIRQKIKRIKTKKNLIQEIYHNKNIFQHSSTIFKRKLTQNIIWQRNYELKMAINLLKEENSSIRARLWNIEKQNRKMDKQIQTWNLTNIFKKSNKKPYIDMATVEKVFVDQDYSIVSKKMEILQSEKIIQMKDLRISELEKRKLEIQKYRSHLNSILGLKKIELCNLVQYVSYESSHQQQLNNSLLQITNDIQLTQKNIEVKKRAKQAYTMNLKQLTQQYEQHKEINYQQIQKLKLETRKMREEDDGSIRKIKKQYQRASKQTFEYECFLQGEMSSFIKTKLELKVKIRELIEKIKERTDCSPTFMKKISMIR